MSDEALIKELRELMADQEPREWLFKRVAERLGKGDISEPVLAYLEAEFATWPKTIKRRAPWEWVTRTCRGWKAPALALANHIDAAWKTLKPKQAAALFASPNVRNLRWFATEPKSRSHIADDGHYAIAASPYLKNLVTLEDWSRPSTEAVVALVSSHNLPSLRWINLRGALWNNAVLSALFEAPLFDTLVSIEMYNARIGSDVSAADRERLVAKLRENYERYEDHHQEDCSV